MEVCKALLAAVPSEELAQYLSLPTTHGFSAVYCAVLSGETDIVEMFARGSFPVDLEAPDLGGLRPLHIAAEKGYSGAVRALLLAGCDSTAKDSIGRTPIDWAMAKHHEECVALLQSSLPLSEPFR